MRVCISSNTAFVFQWNPSFVETAFAMRKDCYCEKCELTSFKNPVLSIKFCSIFVRKLQECFFLSEGTYYITLPHSNATVFSDEKAIKTTKIEYCLCMDLYELNSGQIGAHRLQTTTYVECSSLHRTNSSLVFT